MHESDDGDLINRSIIIIAALLRHDCTVLRIIPAKKHTHGPYYCQPASSAAIIEISLRIAVNPCHAYYTNRAAFNNVPCVLFICVSSWSGLCDV